MGKIKLIVAVVLVATLLAGIFYSPLEFVAGQSAARTESTVSSGRSQDAQEMLRAQPGRKLTIFLQAKDPLASALGRELQKDLAQGGMFGEVLLRPEPGVSATSDVLRVDVDSVDVFWSGVYAQAQVTAVASFSTLGDVSWYAQQPPEFRFYGTDPTIMISGSYTVRDSTGGLVSRNGYSVHLARSLAYQISRSLTSELSGQVQPAT
ncbi:MAG: hypothetical protein EPO21_20925 [Chloroflexota bacterium]|nr:MAG: hypothetical protein EPO21_20925 [Chloroflexota bacterium]